MRRFSFSISRYIFQAVLPYFIFTWLLISVILFVQQASRYSDLLFNTALPNSLIWQLTFALIPNVIAFTCPMAVLVGVIIGLSRMQGDSEMVAMRAAGVGNFQVALPIVFLGILLSLFAFFINLSGVPIAAQIVRQVALQAALYKLESPIEPGIFNSEINNFTIYVKGGNIAKGNWEDIFIFQEDKKTNEVRLITSNEGGIDTNGEDSEISLKDASVTTFQEGSESKVITEKIEDLRLVIQTKRGELIERIAKAKESPEEMGLQELAAFGRTLTGKDRIESYILLQRRLLLSVTPLIFALLGTALVAKFNRGGRGFGAFLSLFCLVFYYLITLLGEQLARTEVIKVITAALIPLVLSVFTITWLFISQRFVINKSSGLLEVLKKKFISGSNEKLDSKNSYLGLSTGILDFDLILNLLKFYALTVGFLSAIFVIFTAFELWKFAGEMEQGIWLLGKYLIYLLPFIYIQLSPSALMIAAITTYVIKSRQNEIVVWTAAGLSVYRLLLPCFMLMFIIGLTNFGFQELVLNNSNVKQDSLREQLRSKNAKSDDSNKFWVAGEHNIYSFNKLNASDNEKSFVTDLTIYEFANNRIESIIKVGKAFWDVDKIKFIDQAEKISWKNNVVFSSKVNDYQYLEKNNPFQKKTSNSNHLNISQITSEINQSTSVKEKRNYSIALYKKYSTPFLPFIIILFTTPFALTLGRKGNVITIGYAIAVWLLFMGTISIFEQLGQSGFISPALSIWSPLVLFTVIGMYLLTKIRT